MELFKDLDFLTRFSSDVPKLPITNLACRSNPLVSRLDEEGMENLEAVCSVTRSSVRETFLMRALNPGKVMTCSSMMETLETS